MNFIETPHAPLPAGHYSQAVCANGFVFVSGILPIVPNREEREIPTDLRAQVMQVFANLEAILAAAESGLEHVVSIQIFVSDVAHWGIVNEVYVERFGSHKPARTVIPCGPLHYNVALEANAVAVTNDRTNHR